MASRDRYVGIACGQDGVMDAYLADPPQAPKGSLVVVQEIFGVNAAMRDIADDLAAGGYVALVPDIFWRMERRVELGNGEPGPDRDKAVSMLSRFDVEKGVADLTAAAAWLRLHRGKEARVGIVGFCLGGRMAALVAADNSVDAATVFYGVGLDNYLDRLRKIAVPVQFHFGVEDTQIPSATIEKVKQELAVAKPVRRDVFVYSGAGHAFYNKHRADRFDAKSHGLARERMLEFFASSLR